jgi:hypothetical protein
VPKGEDSKRRADVGGDEKKAALAAFFMVAMQDLGNACFRERSVVTVRGK